MSRAARTTGEAPDVFGVLGERLRREGVEVDPRERLMSAAKARGEVDREHVLQIRRMDPQLRSAIVSAIGGESEPSNAATALVSEAGELLSLVATAAHYGTMEGADVHDALRHAAVRYINAWSVLDKFIAAAREDAAAKRETAE